MPDCAPRCGAGARIPIDRRSAADDQIHRLWALALLVGLDVEADALALVERFQARALDGRDVHEHVAPPIVRLDEAVAALAVEELDRIGHCHREAPFPNVASPPGPHGAAARPDIHKRGKASAANSLSHLRRPPLEAERRSQHLGSKPTPPRWKEAGASSRHFPAASQSSRTPPRWSRPSTSASAGSSFFSSGSRRHGGLTSKSPLPIKDLSGPAAILTSARKIFGTPSSATWRPKRSTAARSLTGYQSR